MKPNVWNQLKNITCDELIDPLIHDGWEYDGSHGAVHVYRHNKNGRRVTIHWHPKETYGDNLLKAFLKEIGWSENDMRRLRLIR
jgi:predicted RNA binding protein YcfA (HicA-like mRNA interferase family)